MTQSKSKTLAARYRDRGVICPLLPDPVQSLSDYMAVLDSAFRRDVRHKWFRGHASHAWQLAPSAMRYNSDESKGRALGLLADFKRVADFRIQRPPPFSDELRWMQLAQHHGLPTRLLDWTSNAAVALYFACINASTDGIVYYMDPTQLNYRILRGDERLLDPDTDKSIIAPYLTLGAPCRQNGRHRTIAVQPVINSERIQLQRGSFTLHGNRSHHLDPTDVPSLCAIAILKEDKATLEKQLADIGIDEMSIFPEHDHLCSHLIKAAGLPRDFNDA